MSLSVRVFLFLSGVLSSRRGLAVVTSGGGYEKSPPRKWSFITWSWFIVSADLGPNRTAIANCLVASLLRMREAEEVRCCRDPLILQILFSHWVEKGSINSWNMRTGVRDLAFYSVPSAI